jgi:hypothetical protein
MKIILVTIAIGDKYLQEYNTYFRRSQEAYAQRCGYDFKVITEFLDPRLQVRDLISFNKILVCSTPWARQYDFVIFIDADIFISSTAPPIHSAIDYMGKIGIVNEYSQPTFEKRLAIQKRMGWESDPSAYYKLAGFDIQTYMVLNTGVLVMQPAKHREILEIIYTRHFLRAIGHPRGFHFEQSCIGYELQTSGLFAILPNTFNAIWGIYKMDSDSLDLQEFVNTNYFIHFAGRVDIHKIPTLRT